jgi:hypothetical protein
LATRNYIDILFLQPIALIVSLAVSNSPNDDGATAVRAGSANVRGNAGWGESDNQVPVQRSAFTIMEISGS